MDKETFSILKLSLTPGIGPITIHRLMDRYGGAEKVLSLTRGELAESGAISQNLAENIKSGPPKEAVEEEIDLLSRCDAALISIRSSLYPQPLKELDQAAPPLLRIRGSYTKQDMLAIAVVGARNCTHYGRRQARRFSMEFAERGFTVVSGHARGVDVESHRGALQAGGRTIAVLGCGIARIESLCDPELALEIAEQGVLISELPMNAPPLPAHFPPRNRLISGLSTGVVIVEAGARSGSLITARYAGEQGRAVFAVPGSVESGSSRGCHKLINDGVSLAESPSGVVSELGPVAGAFLPPAETHPQNKSRAQTAFQTRSGLSDLQRRVLDLLEHEPRQLDGLICDSRLAAAELISALSSLEIIGLITRLPGESYIINTEKLP